MVTLTGRTKDPAVDNGSQGGTWRAESQVRDGAHLDIACNHERTLRLKFFIEEVIEALAPPVCRPKGVVSENILLVEISPSIGDTGRPAAKGYFVSDFTERKFFTPNRS